MKWIILTIILLPVLYLAYGQVETKFYPNKDALKQVKFIRNHPKTNKIKTFPSFDTQKLIDEDKLNERLDIPFRFGKGFDTNITLHDRGWTNVDYRVIVCLDQQSVPDIGDIRIFFGWNGDLVNSTQVDRLVLAEWMIIRFPVYLSKIRDKMVNPSVNANCKERLIAQLQEWNWSDPPLIILAYGSNGS